MSDIMLLKPNEPRQTACHCYSQRTSTLLLLSLNDKKKLSVYVLYCWFNELIKGEGAAYITLFIYAFFIRNASGYLNLSDKGIQKKTSVRQTYTTLQLIHRIIKWIDINQLHATCQCLLP